MRRITICLDDEIYLSLIDYAARQASSDLVRLSISRAMRKIIHEKLGEMSLYPPKSLERLQRLVKTREKLTIQSGGDSLSTQPALEETVPFAKL